MSSNSWSDVGQAPPSETIEELLTSAIELLAVELPAGFDLFVHRGHGMVARLLIDDESFVVDFSHPGGVDLLPSGTTVSIPTPTVHLRTSRAAVHRVLSGQATLIELLVADQLQLFGSVAAVSQLHDTLMAFMQAAVRCPSMPGVLRRFGDPAESDVT